MNKFHLINPLGNKQDSMQVKKTEEFVRSTNKVMYYNDIKVY